MQKPSPSSNPPPRVEIWYEVETGGQIQRRQLPFVIGVLADLAGQPSETPRRLRDRKFIEVNAENFDAVLDGCAPRLSLRLLVKIGLPGVDNPDEVKMAAELRFHQMRDFSPLAVASQILPLKELLQLRGELNNLRALLWANNRLDDLLRNSVLGWSVAGDTENPEDRVREIVEQGHFGRFAEDIDAATLSLLAFFSELKAGHIVLAPTSDAMLAERIAAIDHALSGQLNEVFHHPDFQRLEASWRGLEYLVHNTATSPMLKIKILNASKEEVRRDLQRAPEFDQSALFKKVYEEYDIFGADPFAVMVADYPFDQSPVDVEMLEHFSQIAAVAHMPFIAAAPARMFNLDSFRELSMPRDLSKIFDSVEYRRWKTFREAEDARYVGLVLPRVLQRLPYGREGLAAEGFDYEEGVDGRDPERYLWGNAVFAFAARLTEAFARYGWCVAITGLERAGVVRGLPLQRFVSDDGDTVVTCPTEIAITDRRREELSRLGFIPLSYEKGSDRAVFFDAHACHRPTPGLNWSWSEPSPELTSLEYIFAVSRFAQYFKVIARDKTGSFQGRRECERYLNNWLADYILLDDEAEPEMKSRYPLREGHVTVAEVPGYSGRYRVSAQLRPHYQISVSSESVPETVAILDAPKG
jgi:type VI secretion system protein ImpC